MSPELRGDPITQVYHRAIGPGKPARIAVQVAAVSDNHAGVVDADSLAGIAAVEKP